MNNYIFLLYSFWFFRTLKHVLFWLYLWQLKEYHVGRFLDHFTTHKGKKSVFNLSLFVKIIIAILFLLNGIFLPYSIYFLILFYFAEFIFFIRAIFINTVKTPKSTAKTMFLGFMTLSVTILFLLFVFLKIKDIVLASTLLLTFDILSPIIISVIVLLAQPAAVLIRNAVLKKAEEKIKKHKDIIVIGITGSYGKTSTKEFLTTIISKKFKTLSTLKHQNSEIGIAKCVLNHLKPDHEVFVVEMGSYNKGGIKLLCNMVGPKMGIVTGVNEQHLALFGSLENLLSAEGGGELAFSLSKIKNQGILILNGDNKYCLDLYKKSNYLEPEKKKIYSVKANKINSDIWTEDIVVSENDISFITINKEGALTHFRVNVYGKHNVQNLLAAILTAKELGMTFEEIAEACKSIKPEQAGITLRKGQRNISIVDSSYSSNPDGVLADLDYLSVFPRKKIIVMPCLIELGKKSKEVHKKIGEKIGEICDIAIITTRDRFEEVKAGALSKGMEEKNIVLYENVKDIYTMIMLFAREGDSVLLEGRIPESLIKLLI